MIDVEDWAEIRRLHRAEKLSIKAIVRRTGLARNTVREALRSDAPPKYERARTGSLVDAVEPQIRELLAEFPSMPTVVMASWIIVPWSPAASRMLFVSSLASRMIASSSVFHFL